VKTDVEVVKGAEQVALQKIDFQVSARPFVPGDYIEITNVIGSFDTLKPGGRYTVKGNYKLSSCDEAMLHLYATDGETKCEQNGNVARGQGQFERTFDYLKQGWLHLSFYPAKGGSSFGGVYFDNKGVDAKVLQFILPEVDKVSISSAKDINEQTIRSAKPDIDTIDVAVESFDIRPYPEGGLYTATVSIRNKGTKESPKFGVNFYRGDPNETKPMTHEAGPIKPGKVWNERSMPFALKEGANEIAVLLDPDNTIGESDRTNNEASMKVVVKDGKIVEKKVFTATTEDAQPVIGAAGFGEGKSDGGQ
jgi:hypothetical protein